MSDQPEQVRRYRVTSERRYSESFPDQHCDLPQLALDERGQVVLASDYDTLLTAYQQVCAERDTWQRTANRHLDEIYHLRQEWDALQARCGRLEKGLRYIRDARGRSTILRPSRPRWGRSHNSG